MLFEKLSDSFRWLFCILKELENLKLIPLRKIKRKITFQPKSMNKQEDKINQILSEAADCYEVDDFVQQIHLYKQVLKLDKNNIKALINISDCYLKLNLAKEAKVYAYNAYKLYREVDDMATVNYSCFLIDVKDYTQAIEILEKEKAKGSDNFLVNNNLGYSYFLTEQYAKALDHYNISIALEEVNPLAYCNHGNLKYTILKDEEGIEDLQKAQLYGDFEASMILQHIGSDKSILS